MNGSYRGINFNRARMPLQTTVPIGSMRQGIIDPSRMGLPQIGVDGGSMRQEIISAPTMREALMQQVRPQPVAEILSEGLPEMMPDLGGASSTADRKREIADLLTQRAMGRNATSIGTGLAQLGEAFIARGATKRADEAETTRDKITRDLLATAMGGGPDAAAARAQIEGMTGAPAALAAFDARQAAEAEQQRMQKQNEMLASRFSEDDPRRAALLAGVGQTQALEEMFRPLPEAPKPFEMNGVLVDPVTYEPLADFRTPEQKGGLTEHQRRELALKEAAAAREAAAQPVRLREKDENGVWRYLDTKERVFPNVTTAPAPAKPLIGAEAMARVAAGLPTAKQAVANLRSLIQNSKGTALSMEGYRPGRDWGAGLLQDVGHIPVVGGLVRPLTETFSRTLGGKDYQMFEDSYGAYEAAILPIMSGAAVTDTEALRQMRAVRIKPGDNKETIERKLSAMDMQIQGLEMAARGDVEGFLRMLDKAGEVSGTGPVKRGTGAETDPEVENLVNMYSGAQ